MTNGTLICSACFSVAIQETIVKQVHCRIRFTSDRLYRVRTGILDRVFLLGNSTSICFVSRVNN